MEAGPPFQAMKKIAVGIDFTKVDDQVVETAVNLARLTGAELHVLHMWAPIPAYVGYEAYAYPGEDERQEELEEEKRRLREVVSGIEAGGVQARAFMREGTSAEGLLELAEENQVDLLVIGTHSRRLLERALVGSTTDRIIRKSHLPTLVVPTM